MAKHDGQDMGRRRGLESAGNVICVVVDAVGKCGELAQLVCADPLTVDIKLIVAKPDDVGKRLGDDGAGWQREGLAEEVPCV